MAVMELTSWEVVATRPEKPAVEKAACYSRKPGASLNAAEVAAVEIVTRDSRCRFFWSLGSVKKHTAVL